MDILKNDKWYSILEKNPDKDGIYYVFMSNCMDNSKDIYKVEYKNKQWNVILEEYTRIMAWKNTPDKVIRNEEEWLKNHINEIRIAFCNDTINYTDCCIAETFDECLYEYEYFLWSGYVRFIDGIFVVRVI